MQKVLKKAIGEPLAQEMLKGCQVSDKLTDVLNRHPHIVCLGSLYSVCSTSGKQVNTNNKQGRDAFVAIGQKILKANSAEDVITLFEVLKGDRSLTDASQLMHITAHQYTAH